MSIKDGYQAELAQFREGWRVIIAQALNDLFARAQAINPSLYKFEIKDGAFYDFCLCDYYDCACKLARNYAQDRFSGDTDTPREWLLNISKYNWTIGNTRRAAMARRLVRDADIFKKLSDIFNELMDVIEWGAQQGLVLTTDLTVPNFMPNLIAGVVHGQPFRPLNVQYVTRYQER